MDHRIIVGLGNPGQKYTYTRHNIGFLAVERLAKDLGADFSYQARIKADVAKVIIGGISLWLVKPDTYMNLSGEAVQAAVKSFGVDVSKELLVVADDLNLEFGRIRIKPEGSDGGHNGLKSIHAHLQTQNYPRLRMGIGRPAPGRDAADFVLGEFLATERDGLTNFLEDACECCRIWIRQDIARAMERYNTKKETEEDGKK